MIRSFCTWCETKKATEEWFPFCSQFCKQKDLERP